MRANLALFGADPFQDPLNLSQACEVDARCGTGHARNGFTDIADTQRGFPRAVHRVTIQPDSRSVEVRSGERLLSAAWKAGVGIKSVCGGRGKCGSCIVEVDAVADAALTAHTDTERELLPEHPRGGIYRLACMCEVQGDVSISVPPESQAVRSAPRKPHTVTSVAARPLASRVSLSIDAASSQPPRSLATRIAQAAAKALGRREVEIPLDVMSDYSTIQGFDNVRELTATVFRERRVVQVLAGRHERVCGIAVDVGTTSFVVFLCDLKRGEILAMRTAGNPQAIYGEDVISRMTHIQQDATTLAAMRKLLVDDINRLVGEACVECGVAAHDIVDAVLVGNPTMQHILLGINPESLGRGPYLPIWSEGADVEAASLGLAMAPRARAFVFPMVSGYIGGDTLAALLTRGADFYRGTQLLVDVGTNGEVVLSHDGRLTATSCATGPVYEGAHIRCGVRAAPGAIERVWVDAGGRSAGRRSRPPSAGDEASDCRPAPDRPVRLGRDLLRRGGRGRRADRHRRRAGGPREPPAVARERRGPQRGAGAGRGGRSREPAARSC